MSEMTVFHGSRSLFDRPSHEFLGEGLTHSENGYGFYVTDCKETALEHAGQSLQDGGIIYSYRVDKNMIDNDFLVSDVPIGQKIYDRLVTAVKECTQSSDAPINLDILSPDITGKRVFGMLKGGYFSASLDPTTRAGAENLSSHGIKGIWYKGEDAICIFDLDDVPQSRIEMVAHDFTEGQNALQRQELDDLNFVVASGTPEFQDAFQAYADRVGFNFERAKSITELPNYKYLLQATGEYASPTSFSGGLPNLKDPEIRHLWGKLHDATFPDSDKMEVQSVPADQIDSLSLREKVELRYVKNDGFVSILRHVYATGDVGLVDAVESYAATLDLSPNAKYSATVNSVANDLTQALGESFYSQPETPDKMGEKIKNIYGADENTQAHIDAIREAVIDYGERFLGVTSAAREAAREVEAIAAARNNPIDLMAKGQYMSESLGLASWEIKQSGDPILQDRFRDIASRLLSDEYNRSGLPGNMSHGRHIDNGYDLRAALGGAVTQMIGCDFIDNSTRAFERWGRQKEHLFKIAGDDPKLVAQFEALEKSLFSYVEQVHGVKATIPNIANPHLAVDDVNSGADTCTAEQGSDDIHRARVVEKFKGPDTRYAGDGSLLREFRKKDGAILTSLGTVGLNRLSSSSAKKNGVSITRNSF